MMNVARMERRRSERKGARSEDGFSIIELLIAVSIFLVISGIVTSGLLQATNSQRAMVNRVDMHAGVRSATELLQQEVGQAGRVAIPGAASLSAAVGAGAQTVIVNQTIGGVTAASVAGLFVGEQVLIDSGAAQETVTITAINTVNKQITATFANAHLANAPLQVYGGFASGIVPPQPGFPNGSTATVLKMYGDINGDGNMVYVEYTCDPVAGRLYRNSMAFNAAAKPAVTSSQSLLDNVEANPGGIACFTYMPNPLPVVGTDTYVLDVAITLTVHTEIKDPTTHQLQKETKALLNVSPRNVFFVWQLASANILNRIQPMPASVTALLP